MSTAAALVALVAVICGCAGPVRSPRTPPLQTGRSGIRQTLDAAYAAGFRTEKQLLAVTAIAVAESSLAPRARNWHPEYGYRPTSDVIGVAGGPGVRSNGRQVHSDRGLWQISSHWWPEYTDAQCDNPASAARAVFTISKRGTDFSPWDVYDSGVAQGHYDRADDGWPALRPLVRALLAAKPG